MADIVRLERDLIAGFEPQRPEEGHKNTFGTALICAGSEFMTGAAVMATGSALRSGAGLVKVFSEEKTLDAVRFSEPCAMLELRPDNTAALLRKAKGLCSRISSVLIGSGIPRDYKDMEALTEVFLKDAPRVVLDAGVLSGTPDVMARTKERLKERTLPAVITPHVGEFARILRIAAPEVEENAEELSLSFSRENNVVTVLKSSRTLIATPDGKLFVNDVPNSGLSKGGSGDVLAGLLTGLLAQGMEPYEAACSAVFIHSRAGKAVAERMGVRTMLPTDVISGFEAGFKEAGWLR